MPSERLPRDSPVHDWYDATTQNDHNMQHAESSGGERTCHQRNGKHQSTRGSINIPQVKGSCHSAVGCVQ